MKPHQEGNLTGMWHRHGEGKASLVAGNPNSTRGHMSPVSEQVYAAAREDSVQAILAACSSLSLSRIKAVDVAKKVPWVLSYRPERSRR